MISVKVDLEDGISDILRQGHTIELWSCLKNSQVSLQLGSSEVRPQGIMETLGIVLGNIGELQKLNLVVGDGLGLPALKPTFKLQ